MAIVNADDLNSYIQAASSDSLMAARVDLRQDLFDLAIQQKGYRIIWEQGMFCSCLTRESGQPNYNCPSCGGKGYVYFNPKEIRAVVTSISGYKEQTQIGLNEMGTAYLTPRSSDKIGFRDRFTFLDFTIKYSEVIRHSGTGRDKLGYPAKSVLMVRVLNQEYVQGTDFTISDDGWYIEWINSPLYQDSTYSILYIMNPVYIAMGPIHELRGTYNLRKGQGMEVFVKLPDQYQIKREDFLDEGIYNPYSG